MIDVKFVSLTMAGSVNPVFDGALGCVGCSCEYGEVVPEAVGVSGVDSGLAFLLGVTPGISPLYCMTAQ
ncbi:MAG: hypothetical protein HFF84_16285 [Oscillibacter sp.]|nr:hypothetical protein [Oscillibacter sp.]